MTTDRTTEALPDSPASAPLLDLQALVVAVRRRRRLWCSMALLGLLAGAAAAVLLRPEPTAVTKVLVTHQADQPNDTGTLIRTDVELLGTTRIAGRALKSLKSTEKPEDFMRDYRGTGLTNNVLEIEVTGESDADAVARAEALADAFVADHVTRMREAAEAESQALLDQRDRVQGELDEVNKSIGDRTPESDPAASASLESLFARRAELNSRIADFDERAAQARTGAPQVLAGTQIVDTPRAVRHSLPRAVGTDAAIGLALGLVLGLGLARSARWWPTVPSCAARSPRVWAPRSSRSCATRPADRPGGGSAGGPGRPANGSPARWPAPSVTARDPCRCWSWDVRAAPARSPWTSPVR